MLTVVKILLAWTGTLKIIYLEKVKVIIYLEKVKVELAPFEHPFDMLLNIIFNIFAHRMS